MDFFDWKVGATFHHPYVSIDVSKSYGRWKVRITFHRPQDMETFKHLQVTHHPPH